MTRQWTTNNNVATYYYIAHDGICSLHNEAGPAVIYANGDKEWWINGMRHRENGPAIDRPNHQSYFLLGHEISEGEYKSSSIKKLILKIKMIGIIET